MMLHAHSIVTAPHFAKQKCRTDWQSVISLSCVVLVWFLVFGFWFLVFGFWFLVFGV